ncbi:MAG: hypothetical protein AB8H47_14970 [Bacteroidia bacterium]
MKKLKSLFWIQAIALGLFIAGCDSFGGIGKTADISKLEGDWIRVESNNPGSDFMTIRMSGTTGTITDKAGSGFVVGDTKWDLITAGDEKDVYPYQELGSDYNYYDAVITLVNEDEISITVGSSGAGNAQKWVRDDGSIVPTVGETLDCNSFGVDRTLTNGPADVDYIVPNGCVLDIKAALTIEPGTVIEFEENAGIGVYDQGTISAVGTTDKPIILRGTQNVSGYWRGIHVETNSISNRLESITIKNAGSNYVYCCNEIASVFLKGGKMAFKDVTITDGENHGIYANSSVQLPTYENVTITTHKAEPLAIAPVLMQYLDGSGSDYSGNDKDFIRVLDGNVDEAISVPANNVPYLFDGRVIDIIEAMTIEAGAELVMNENGGLGVYDSGSLKILGTSSNPVSIRGREAVAGYWRGIHIETTSLNNDFQYVNISDAGSDYVYCCNIKASVFLKGGKLSIANSNISNGSEYGLYANDAAELRSFSSNTITTHNESPLYIAPERAAELDGVESDFTGNTADFIQIFDGAIDNVTNWKKTNVPYLIETTAVIDVKQPLTIEPGTEIVFGAEAGIGIYDQGSINAIGTSSARIVFRGSESSQGYWRGVHVETNSSANEFDYVTVANAGSNYVYCCNDKAGLILKGGQMTVSNSLFNESGGCGIFVRSGSNLTESNNTFFNNADGDLCN